MNAGVWLGLLIAAAGFWAAAGVAAQLWMERP